VGVPSSFGKSDRRGRPTNHEGGKNVNKKGKGVRQRVYANYICRRGRTFILRAPRPGAKNPKRLQEKERPVYLKPQRPPGLLQHSGRETDIRDYTTAPEKRLGTTWEGQPTWENHQKEELYYLEPYPHRLENYREREGKN